MQDEIKRRREQFIDQMAVNSAAIFFAAPEVTRSNDTHYPYRQNSDFWYLTAFEEPEAALILIKKAERVTTILFNRSNDPLAETWTGYRLGQTQAITTLAVDEAYPIAEINQRLPQLISSCHTLYHADQLYPHADTIVNQLLQTLRSGLRQGLRAPTQVIDWRPQIHEQRLFKSPAEIDIMRQAGEITAQGHCRAMKMCQPGQYEYQLESEILYYFSQQGARHPSYNTIVGGGNNGCILHYEENSAPLQAGELVLIDAGCEYHYYAGDITRTFPINGRFTPAQRRVYDLVLKAQYCAIALFKPGTTIKAVNDEVIRIMVEGLVELSILQGDPKQLIADQAYLDFYMHGLGHWLGIDVHDVGDHITADRERVLAPGMVLTVEPGLYINRNANVPEPYKGIGIRIEDNILITATGNEVLTASVPKDPEAIEQFMQQR